MKKILYILIGIVLGISMSNAFFRYGIMRFYYEVADQTGEKPFIAHVGDLQVTQFGDGIYGITAQKNPNTVIMVKHSSGQNIMSEIEILDDSNTSLNCEDMDSDGLWDSWIFSNEKTVCTYGLMSGYPDTVIEEGKEPLVRIDGVYFPFQNIDDKIFIEKDGELVELEYMPTRYFKIK